MSSISPKEFDSFTLRPSISRILDIRDQKRSLTCWGQVACLVVSYDLKTRNTEIRDYEASVQHLMDNVYKHAGGTYFKDGPKDRHVRCSLKEMEYYECNTIDALNYILKHGVYLHSDYSFIGKVNKNNKKMLCGDRIMITEVHLLDNDTPPETLREILVQGHIIAGSVYISEGFENHKGEGVYRGDEGSPEDGVHCIGVVGIGYDNGDLYFEIRNSFGSDWCHGGYAKILAKYVALDCYIKGAYIQEEEELHD